MESSVLKQINTVSTLIASMIRQLRNKSMWKIAGIFGCVGVLSVGISKLRKRWRHCPPQVYGIHCLPLVGSIFAMSLYSQHFFLRVLPSYGDLVMFNIGPVQFCHLNDPKLITHLFNKVIDRSQDYENLFATHGYPAPLSNAKTGLTALGRSKTISRNLTDLLKNKKVQRDICSVTSDIVCKHLDLSIRRGKGSYQWQPRDLCRRAVFSVIYVALFGSILDSNEKEKFSALDGYTRDLLRHAKDVVVGEKVQPWLADLVVPGACEENNSCKSLKTSMHGLYKFVCDELNSFLAKKEEDMQILSSVSSLDSIDSCYSLDQIDTLVARMQSSESVHAYAAPAHKDQAAYEPTSLLVTDLVSILLSGLDTTSHANEVGVILLAKYPHVQETLYKELSEAYGGEGNFSLSKVSQCPHLRAFAAEVVRISTPLPTGVARHVCGREYRVVKYVVRGTHGPESRFVGDYLGSSSWNSRKVKHVLNKAYARDAVEYDYIIPKDTALEMNANYINFGKKNVWNVFEKDPMAVNLNNWLKKDSNGGVEFCRSSQNSQSVSFGIGKRACPGQTLAMAELHAFLGSLVLKYRIDAAGGSRPDGLKLRFKTGDGMAVVEPQVSVCVKKRILSPIERNAAKLVLKNK